MIIKTEIQREVALTRIRNLRLDSRGYDFTLKPIIEKRSIDQNKLMWLWLCIIERETGQPKEELHEIFKAKYLGLRQVRFGGIDIMVTNSTKKLDTKQMSEYLGSIKKEMNEFGISLPSPEDRDLAECISFYSDYL